MVRVKCPQSLCPQENVTAFIQARWSRIWASRSRSIFPTECFYSERPTEPPWPFLFPIFPTLNVFKHVHPPSEACRKLGVLEKDVFSTVDLFEAGGRLPAPSPQSAAEKGSRGFFQLLWIGQAKNITSVQRRDEAVDCDLCFTVWSLT